jgi:predicted 3-demethylubiquinone-9 3-methyltransferase (glyoxalase superfamily)
MQSLAPCLMFVGDQYGNAEEAMTLYVSAFEDSRILEVDRLEPDGEGKRPIKRARLVVADTEIFVMDSDGPHAFAFNPAISMTVELDDRDAIDSAWDKLGVGGTVLMPLDSYEFSPRFGWVQDRFGVSWQLNLLDQT